MPANSPPYLTPAQAAAALGIHERTVRHWVMKLALGWRPNARTILLGPADMEALRERPRARQRRRRAAL